MNGVLAAAPSALEKATGSPILADGIAGIRNLLVEALRAEVLEGPVISTSRALHDYLRLTTAESEVEIVRGLYLDRQNRLLADEVITRGSIAYAPVHPRTILRRALDLRACALILVHNHPSGDPTPSTGDLSATRVLAEAGKVLDLVLHDHVIVGRAGCSSLRELGFL